jgi:hypothetical protein
MTMVSWSKEMSKTDPNDMALRPVASAGHPAALRSASFLAHTPVWPAWNTSKEDRYLLTESRS